MQHIKRNQEISEEFRPVSPQTFLIKCLTEDISPWSFPSLSLSCRLSQGSSFHYFSFSF